MAKGKQAKILNEIQFKRCLKEINEGRNNKRNIVMFLLSAKAGLRAIEIAQVTWSMVTDAEGNISDSIELQDVVTKAKCGGRSIPMHPLLAEALKELKGDLRVSPKDCVVHSERGDQMKAHSIVNWFATLYRNLGFDGCSSHSGRRTFITNTARQASLVGGCLRDVQQMAGHSDLVTTQRYIEGNSEAKRKMVHLS